MLKSYFTVFLNKFYSFQHQFHLMDPDWNKSVSIKPCLASEQDLRQHLMSGDMNTRASFSIFTFENLNWSNTSWYNERSGIYYWLSAPHHHHFALSKNNLKLGGSKRISFIKLILLSKNIYQVCVQYIFAGQHSTRCVLKFNTEQKAEE